MLLPARAKPQRLAAGEAEFFGDLRDLATFRRRDGAVGRADREAALTRQVEQSTAAEELALDRYNRGLQDILTLLTAQVQTAQAKSRLLEARRLRLENRVDLHLALGGGFDRLEALQENDQDSDPELDEAR